MRIKQIANMVDNCNVVADIGTDHGYVAEIVLRDNKCNKVIASDLNKGPLENAREYLTSVGLGEKVDFRLGSGLEVLQPDEADIVVIAGMGGLLINKLLAKCPEVTNKVDKFILQPMTAVDKVRKYLYENNMRIVSESLVKEYHHYYYILKVEQGKDIVEDEIYFEISKYLLQKKDKLLGEYLDKQIEVNYKIIDNIKDSTNKNLITKKESLLSKIDKLEEIKKKYDFK